VRAARIADQPADGAHRRAERLAVRERSGPSAVGERLDDPDRVRVRRSDDDARALRIGERRAVSQRERGAAED
jgi:hypothetical protein